VANTLDEVARAATRRDADAILERLSATFTGQGGLTRAETGAELRRYFALYALVEVGLADVAIDRPQRDTAVARFRASFAGRPRAVAGLRGMLPEAERFRFEVTLAEQDGEWRLVGATWERLDRAS
jgi:predicted component of type VI protein secretion system